MILNPFHYLRDVVFSAYHSLPIQLGESVFSEEWDMLILLDACRPDALRQRGNYDWAGEVEVRLSVGSDSVEWMSRTLDAASNDILSSTAYITGNPFSANNAPGAELAYLDEVWRYAWDDDNGIMPARPITDRAIAAARNRGFKRLIVHYMQPHFPSVESSIAKGKSLSEWGDNRMQVWDRLQSGEIDVNTVWDAYLANLDYVLTDVDLLLRNINAPKTVISADHGEAFGEWGIYGHGHEPAPILRRVPWVETFAKDNETYEPSEYDDTGNSDVDISERLKALGYR